MNNESEGWYIHDGKKRHGPMSQSMIDEQRNRGLIQPGFMMYHPTLTNAKWLPVEPPEPPLPRGHVQLKASTICLSLATVILVATIISLWVSHSAKDSTGYNRELERTQKLQEKLDSLHGR